MRPARLYTGVAGVFLLLQGAATLTFRLVPALDRAFPPLLATTQMRPLHSGLHLLTGALALVALSSWGGGRGPRLFAAGFGLFYSALAVFGLATHRSTLFELQPFDHPFHLGLGVAGLVVAALDSPSDRKRKPT